MRLRRENLTWLVRIGVIWLPIVTNQVKYRDGHASARKVARCESDERDDTSNLTPSDFAQKCKSVDFAHAAALCAIGCGTTLRARIGDRSVPV